MKILILITILIIIFLQYKTINYKNNSYDILQSDNPTKDKFEDIISRKCVTVFLNILKDLEAIKELDYNDLQNMGDKNKNIFREKLNNHLKYYLTPLCLTYNFTLNIEKTSFKTDIKRVTSYRHLHCQINGNQRLILFNHQQDKYLYKDTKNKNISRVNFWDQDLTTFPLISKSKYIEISVSDGQMIYIPYGWWYCYENKSDNMYVICESESLFSYFLKN